MTDSEFWAVMAITVEQAQSMPDWKESYKNWACPGLCRLVLCAYYQEIIDQDQCNRLSEQISLVRPRYCRGMYYWHPEAWAPRVRAMKKLAKLAQS